MVQKAFISISGIISSHLLSLRDRKIYTRTYLKTGSGGGGGGGNRYLAF